MRRSVLLSLFALALLAAPAYAFLDDVAQLKDELQAYQSSHTTNFGDLVARLDEIAGPIFDDVPEEAWFFPFVSSVAEWGIVSGYTDATGNKTGTFGPSNPVTIAESLKMAFRAAQVDERQCKPVTNHPQAQSHWAERFVACAEQIDMRVFRKTLPDLNRPARRAEVLAIIDDAFGERVPALFASFRDTPGHPYEADVAYAVVRGVVSGDSDANGNNTGIFRPDDGVNRAEFSKMVYAQLKAKVRLQAQAN